ncbi:hypothetical protein [Haloarcula litorea]|uniref:hypothetical protein n=1 Tax=Haloarcula litorea TaxID=3032579 RepID=UPI0023E8E8B2|nr:hypothetical protein [Halomicroarcula sp. GDY20]
MSNPIEWLSDNREKAQLFLYFLLILALSLPVAGMITQGYKTADLIRSILRLRLMFDVTLTQVSVAGFGLFIGLLVLMSIDRKKRVQAALLWVGVLVSVVVITSQGLGPGVSGAAASGPWLIAGILAGVGAGGGRKLLNFDTVQTVEFRRASEGVYTLLLLVTGLMFIELHLSYPNPFVVNPGGIALRSIENVSVGINQQNLLRNAAITGAFLFLVNRFIQYDADKDFFIVGPKGSGKSLLLAGAFQEVNERSKTEKNATPLNPSEDLMEMMAEFDRQTSGWMLGATGRGELNTLEFQYVHGSVFPTNIKLSGADYAGEYLERIPDAVSGAIDEEEMDTTLQRLKEGVEDATTLIFIIDCERFVDNESLEIAPYFSILQAADDKNALLVATKADHLAEQFEEQQGLEAHQYFDDFQEYVNQQLRQNQNINGLVTQVGDGTIHPVYYQTKEDEQGNTVPMRDDQGNALTVGFGQLLDKLGRM